AAPAPRPAVRRSSGRGRTGRHTRARASSEVLGVRSPLQRESSSNIRGAARPLHGRPPPLARAPHGRIVIATAFDRPWLSGAAKPGSRVEAWTYSVWPASTPFDAR